MFRVPYSVRRARTASVGGAHSWRASDFCDIRATTVFLRVCTPDPSSVRDGYPRATHQRFAPGPYPGSLLSPNLASIAACVSILGASGRSPGRSR